MPFPFLLERPFLMALATTCLSAAKERLQTVLVDKSMLQEGQVLDFNCECITGPNDLPVLFTIA